MEVIGPRSCSTRPGLGPFEPGADAVAPDTIREGTEPLAAPQRIPTAPMVITVPLARVARQTPRLTYEVYTPDDTLRGARALTKADAVLATRNAVRRRRLGLGALGLAITLSTSLMAIASCEDDVTGRVETTAAVTTAPARKVTPPPAASPAPAPTTDDVIPPITFSPPLTPPPPRRRGPVHAPKR
jgi:hypothetical protein